MSILCKASDMLCFKCCFHYHVIKCFNASYYGMLSYMYMYKENAKKIRGFIYMLNDLFVK
jgi:hypothetical protein